jgi:hypothetical protein
VDESPWRGSGPEFTRSWSARQWALKVDDPSPGLCLDQAEATTKLLALDLLAVPGRCDLEAFSRKTLVGYERYRRSIRATFAPPSWGGLLVRASWSAIAEDVVDLEVQITASSVGELEGLEIGVLSRLDFRESSFQTAAPISVEARESASIPEFDTRDSSIAAPCDIHFFSATRPLGPSVFPARAGLDDLYYVEMAHPDDVARRASFESVAERSAGFSGRAIRYALFGLPLEKGVVLRARLRGCWARSRAPEQEAAALYQVFLQEPLPLGP